MSNWRDIHLGPRGPTPEQEAEAAERIAELIAVAQKKLEIPMAKSMKKMDCPCDDCPKAGDVYYCTTCGMTALVTVGCGCADPSCVALACCGASMTLANPKPAP